MQIDQEINDNLKRISTWKRIFFILVFGAILGVVRIILWLIVLLQVVYSLLTGKVNQNVLDFSKKLSAYMYHMWLFLTFMRSYPSHFHRGMRLNQWIYPMINQPGRVGNVFLPTMIHHRRWAKKTAHPT